MNMWDATFYNEKSQRQYQLGINLINEIKFNENENILDLGCGPGKISTILAKNNPSCNVVGIDIDKNMIEQAKINLKKAGFKNVSFYLVDFLKYEPKIKFDVIFSNSVIHWIDDKQGVFQKIKNILNPKGRVGIQMPSSKNLGEISPLFMKPINQLKLHDHFANWKYPLRRISRKKLNEIIEPLGFSSINIVLKNVPMKFLTFEDLLDFLKSAPLIPIISYLPEEFKEKYLNSLLGFLKQEGNEILNITMKRIFIFLEN